GVGADATVTARERAAPDPAGRRSHRPAQPGLTGDAEIDAEAANGCDVRLGAAAFALEYAFKAGGRADNETDILAALALQNPGAKLRLRHRVGACDRRNERRDRDGEGGKSHYF